MLYKPISLLTLAKFKILIQLLWHPASRYILFILDAIHGIILHGNTLSLLKRKKRPYLCMIVYTTMLLTGVV